jgi:hypothetical protein
MSWTAAAAVSIINRMSVDRIPAVVMLLNLVSFTLLMRWFVWPRLLRLDLRRALVPLVAFHWIRTLGILASLPAMTGVLHDSTWAIHIAMGDGLTVVLAWLAVAALRADHRAALPAVWLFNTVGFLDVLNAGRNTITADIPVASLGAQTLIVAFGPPALIVSHVTIFAILLGAGSFGARRA